MHFVFENNAMYMRIKKQAVFSILFLGAIVMTTGVLLLHPTFFFGRKKIGNVVSFPGKDVSLTVEIARNPYQWGKGLMFRDTLANDSGMLFIFPNEGKHPFWMKDTLIPLDILFISQDRKVVTIHKNATPCVTLFCPQYGASANAIYVLEVNAGFADTYNIKEGDSVEIDTE